MSVKIVTKKNDFPKIEATLSGLKGKKVNVGVLGGGEQSWLAGIHEYGCNIKPGNAQYLTVPCNRKSFGKRAGDFDDLFVLTAHSGEKFLAQEVGKDKVECLFWLTKSVHIPERSFLRAGHDAHIDEILDKFDKRTAPLLASGQMDAEEACKELGILLSSKIKDFAKNLNEPAKSSVTIEANGGKSNPLMQTGAMIGAITYEVE